jgi:competence protein ComEA
MGGWLEQHKGTAFGFLVLITIFGGIMVYTRQPDPPPLEISTPEPSPTSTSFVVEIATTQPTNTPKPIRVYITGQVNTPDVYLLPAGSIIKDALEAAGGATEGADLVAINLAQELQDQQQITIPAKAEAIPTPPVIKNGLPTTPNDPVREDRSGDDDTSTGEKININAASLEALTTLSGIGQVIGQRIIDYRTEHGNFATIEQIIDVKGIGPVTFEKIKDHITVE